jgi:transposase
VSSLSLQPIVGIPKDSVPLLQKRVELLEAEVHALHQKLLAARRELAQLKGQDSQQALEGLIAELQRTEAARQQREKDLFEAQSQGEPPQSEAKPARPGHGPRPQPKLPVIEQIHELEAKDRCCKVCGGEMVPMGEQFEELEEITVIERQYVTKVHKRRKYRCKCNSCVVTAPMPPRLIPGGRYSTDFAIHVAVSKYLDHSPLERQCREMDRHDLVATPQALWDQLDAVARVAEPTAEALGKTVLQAPVIHADETRWPMLDGQSSPWTVWSRCTSTIAHYTILGSKSAKAASPLFSGFEGIVVVDGYAVYETLARAGPKLRLANCWAHTARKFVECRENFPAQCQKVLDLIKALYEVERQVPGPFPGDEQAQRLRAALREEFSRPILRQIYDWACTEVGLPESDLGKAVKYMLRRWEALTVFVSNPLVPLDNNAAERSLRGPVIGRKNHYGSKSKRGTEVAAILYTLLETAKLNGLEPASYLRTVVERALRTPGTVTLPQDLL